MLLPILIMLLMIGFMWFSGRKQRKRQKMMQERKNNLKNGDRVMMDCGIYGTVKEIINENGRSIVVLEIATGVKIKIDKSSIFADMSATAQQK